MRKHAILAVAMMLFGTVGAAQTDLDIDPGLVTPDAAAWGLDVALDNIGRTLGVVSPGDIAAERASEAFRMNEENRTEARDRALDELSDVAAIASSDDSAGLGKAEAILQELGETLDADGLSTALDAVQTAQSRVPENVTEQPPVERLY